MRSIPFATRRTFSSAEKARVPKVFIQNKLLAIGMMAFFSIIFGLLCGVNAILAIGLVIIPIVVLLFYNPAYAYYLFVATLPLYVVKIPLLSASIPRLAGGILLFVWLPYVFFTRKFLFIKWDKLLVLIVIFFGWILVSFMWTILPEIGYTKIKSLSQLILAVFIAITLITKPDKFAHVIFIVLITCMIAGFRSFYMSLFTIERAVGIEGFDQNEFASMLLTPLIIAFSLYNQTDSKWKMAAYLIVMFGCFLGALSTVSRGFVLSVTAAFVALYHLEPRKKKMVMLLLIAFLITSPYYMKRYGDRLGSERFELTSTAEVPRGRIGIWLIGIEIYKNHPINGVGIGGFPRAYDEQILRNPEKTEYNKYGRVAHNDYLMILTELGIIGFILWICLISAVFRKANKFRVILEKLDEKYLAAVSRGLIAGFIGLLVASFFLGLYHSKYMWLELTLFILLGNIARDLKQKSSDPAIRKLSDP